MAVSVLVFALVSALISALVSAFVLVHLNGKDTAGWRFLLQAQNNEYPMAYFVAANSFHR